MISVKKSYKTPETDNLAVEFTNVLMTSPDPEFGKKDGEPGPFTAPQRNVF